MLLRGVVERKSGDVVPCPSVGGLLKEEGVGKPLDYP
jgi:hypothetical protein